MSVVFVRRERGVVVEYFWSIVAALGAGVGTGLAGLSAATVMVPILIVLCPSFSGETGAYQATAIALASDILGSAVTAWTYAKHKNIDLKRGWMGKSPGKAARRCSSSPGSPGWAC